MIVCLGISLTSCKKLTLPVVTTENVFGIAQTSAVAAGNVIEDGGSEVTARGIYWGTAQYPSKTGGRMMEGKGTGTFSVSLHGLTFKTKYYIQAYATNSEGTSFGNEVSFTTYGALSPGVTTTTITSITSSAAMSGGYVLYDGLGQVSSRGVCWSTSAYPTISDSKTEDGNGTGTFISRISGLEVNNTYYLRAYATNEAGTAYGELLSFKTEEDLSNIDFNLDLTYSSISDIDGNGYKTIKIGTQEWMAENLRTSRLNDGTKIFHDWPPDVFFSDSPAYILNNTYVTYTKVLGAYYNWYTVETGKLCPSGWHVPSYTDWTTLSNFLGGDSIAGGKLKETGTTHWNDPNSDASNETGFSSVPGGCIADVPGSYRFKQSFQFVGDKAIWWSTTIGTYDCCSWSVFISNDGPGLFFYEDSKENGYPVRCVKDDGTL